MLFTIADALVLELLPLAGDSGPGYVGALLLAAFLNLFVVAVVGPLLGIWLRRRSPDRPAFAARDRASVLALAGMFALVLAAGLIHRPFVAGEEDDLRAQALAARGYFQRHAPAGYRATLPEMTTWKAGEDLYRTCVRGPRPGRELCVYVTTDQSPPGVTLDTSQEPNSVVAGPYGQVIGVR